MFACGVLPAALCSEQPGNRRAARRPKSQRGKFAGFFAASCKTRKNNNKNFPNMVCSFHGKGGIGAPLTSNLPLWTGLLSERKIPLSGLSGRTVAMPGVPSAPSHLVREMSKPLPATHPVGMMEKVPAKSALFPNRSIPCCRRHHGITPLKTPTRDRPRRSFQWDSLDSLDSTSAKAFWRHVFFPPGSQEQVARVAGTGGGGRSNETRRSQEQDRGSQEREGI